MNKQELIEKLQDIEWEDFEVKEAKSEVPKSSWESYYNNTPVISESIDNYRIEFYFKDKETVEKTSEKTSEKIIKLIKMNSEISAEKLSREIGISSRAIEMHLSNLKKIGKIKRVGPDKGGSWEVLE